MKANELMIGDWVHIKKDIIPDDAYWMHDNLHPGQAIRMEEILSNGINPDWYDGEINDYIPEDAIEPIPLTAEILEKNGWKLISNTRYKLEYSWSTGAIEEYADIHICVGKDHSNVWRWDFPILNIHLYRGDMELTKFRYVHELQHALRLFGIKKEIEL